MKTRFVNWAKEHEAAKAAKAEATKQATEPQDDEATQTE
jgi:hypothetical protein